MVLFPSAKVIIKHLTDPQKFLLIKRTVNQFTFYEPIGGKAQVDFSKKTAETFEECAQREVYEEVGYRIIIDNYLGSYYFFWMIDNNKCSICTVFSASIIDYNINFVTNTDTCELSIEPVWVIAQDIIEKKIIIDPMYCGLEKIILDYCRSIQL